jgi:thymidylate synthase
MSLLINDGSSEGQYLSLVRKIIDEGVDRPDRTGIGTRALHGETMRFDLSDGRIPLLTTKRVPWKAIVHELIWFLSGETNIRPLLENNVHIWSDWPHAKYQKETGEALSMTDFEQRLLGSPEFAAKWGDLGPVYGKQWRRWEGPDGKVYDQVSDVLNRIRKDPSSRRLLFHGWNVADLEQMALPPCHLLYQFFVEGNRLSLTMYQRSCDVGLGLPFNLASCALLVRLAAQQTDLEPGSLFWVGHDVHLYQNHLEPIKAQLEREPTEFPRLYLLSRPSDLFGYKIDDLELTGYTPAPSIKMEIAV